MNDWREVTLTEVAAEVTVGHVGSMAQQYQESGVPFLRSLNIAPHSLDLNQVKFISDEFHSKLKKSALRPGDVVTVRTGKPGTTSVIPKDLPVANCSDLVITRPGPSLNAQWFSYYMNSIASNYIDSHLVGAVQQHFNVGSAKSLKLLLPPLAQQQAIAEVLGTLDDKIAANTRLAENADSFINLQFQATIKRSVPTPKPFFEVFNVEYGEAFKGDNFVEPGIGRPLIRIRDLKTFFSQVWTTESRSKEVIVNAGDIVVGMDAEFRATSWLGEPGLLNQRVCRVTSNLGQSAFVRESLRQPLATIENYKTGTTVIHLNKKDLAQSTVLLPDREAIKFFDSTTESLYRSRVALASENRILATTRDALLPQLMSGELHVKDAEALVESVV